MKQAADYGGMPMPDKNLSVSGELLNFRPYSRGQAFAHPGNGPRWPGEEILQETLGIEQFRKHCGLKKIARCGFPWEKTTKRPVAPRISCGAALAENNYVRLSSRKVAWSSAVPPTSTGNPGSAYTNCETALMRHKFKLPEERVAESIFTSTLHSQAPRSAAFLEKKPRREWLLCIHQK